MDQLSAEDSVLINGVLSPSAVSTPRRKFFIFTRPSLRSPSHFRFLNNTAELVHEEENLPQP